MTITVNGEPRTIDDAASVARLLADLRLADAPCAVEVNRRLVPRREHESARLREGDAVEVVTLVGGG